MILPRGSTKWKQNFSTSVHTSTSNTIHTLSTADGTHGAVWTGGFVDIAREREITTTENAKYDTDTKNINQINSNYSRPAHDTTSTGRASSTGVHVCGCASARDGRKWTLGDYCCRSPAHPPNSTTQYYPTPKQQTIGPYPFSHPTEIPLGSRTLTVAMLTQYLLKAFSRATFFPRPKKKTTTRPQTCRRPRVPVPSVLSLTRHADGNGV